MASTTMAQNFAAKVSRCSHVLDSTVVIKRDGESGERKTPFLFIYFYMEIRFPKYLALFFNIFQFFFQ